MGKLIAGLIVGSGILAVITYAELVGVWGYIVSGSVVTLSLAMLFGMKRKTEVVKLPKTTFEAESKRLEEKQKNLKTIKKQIDEIDQAVEIELKKRREEYEENRESPPSVDDIRDKLELIRGRDE